MTLNKISIRKMTPPTTRGNTGFSMVELAIVLVVMGLIVSATLVGRTLIQAAEVRAMISEAENHKLQIDNFVIRFNDLPGDLRKANDYWAATTDGNANGMIETSEAFSAWQQLSLAQLIPGSYSGVGPDATVGTNVPASAYHSGGHDVLWHDTPGSWTDQMGRALPGNYLRYGVAGASTGDTDLLSGAVLTGSLARAIDGKIDNALPSFGKVLAIQGDGITAGCYEADGSAYVATVDTPTCTVLFDMGYKGER